MLKHLSQFESPCSLATADCPADNQARQLALFFIRDVTTQMKKTLQLILLLSLTPVFSQTNIQIFTADCSQENGFTMFNLDEAEPKILSGQSFVKINGYWSGQKKGIINKLDTLKIEYNNIFGQRIDTTFVTANQREQIKLCINKFKDYSDDALIELALRNKSIWILESSWGHQTFENDKLVLRPNGNHLKFQYFLNGKREKKGKIKIDENLIKNIHLFEKKLKLMNRPDGNCNFGQSYRLIIDEQILKVEDHSCSGFSNRGLLRQFGMEK